MWTTKRIRKPLPGLFALTSVIFSAFIHATGLYRLLVRIRFPFNIAAHEPQVEEQYHWQLVRSTCWNLDREEGALVSEVSIHPSL